MNRGLLGRDLRIVDLFYFTYDGKPLNNVKMGKGARGQKHNLILYFNYYSERNRKNNGQREGSNEIKETHLGGVDLEKQGKK